MQAGGWRSGRDSFQPRAVDVLTLATSCKASIIRSLERPMNRYDQRVRELWGEFSHPLVDQPGIHLSEDQLADVEQRLGATLPEDFREFLRDYGCYFFYTTVFPVRPNPDGVQGGSLEKFSGVLYKVVGNDPYDIFDIVGWYEGLCRNIVEWPKEWLPIATGAGSDTVALAIKGEHKGAVYYFFNQWTPNYQNMYLVADSFDEFMGLLKTPPDVLAELEEFAELDALKQQQGSDD